MQNLYSPEAQRLIVENFYRPADPETYALFVNENPGDTITVIPEDGKWINDKVERVDIEHFGGWEAARKKHFVDGGVFDSIYER